MKHFMSLRQRPPFQLHFTSDLYLVARGMPAGTVKLLAQIRQVNDASAVKIPWCVDRTTSTGMVLCVSTLTASLPSTIAEIPRRPCEAMTIRSHDFRAAVSMMARYG